MYHIIFIHSSVSGHLGCFHVLAIVNSAAMNQGVHVSFQIRVLSGYIPQSEIAGSYENSIFNFFCLFRATPMSYGDAQARGQISAVAAGLHHSHSKARSEPCLRPTPQFTECWILNPLSEARDGTCVLMDPSQICFC